MNFKGVAAAFIMMGLLSITPLLVKQSEISAILFNFGRTIVAGILISAYLGWRIRMQWNAASITAVLAGGLSAIVWIVAMREGDVASITAVSYSSVIWVRLISLVWRSQADNGDWTAFSLSALGVLIIIVGKILNGQMLSAKATGLAVLVAILWAVFVCCSSEVAKKYGEKEARVVPFWANLVNGFVTLPFLVPLMWQHDAPAVQMLDVSKMILNGLILGTVFVLTNYSLARISVTQFSIIGSGEIAFATILAMIFLKERPELYVMAGGFLIVVSIFVNLKLRMKDSAVQSM